MTSYLVLYMTIWASKFGEQQCEKSSFRRFRLGVQPHEIAALNAKYGRRRTANRLQVAVPTNAAKGLGAAACFDTQ